MKKAVTSREAILAASRKLVMESGLQAVNMRTVASACGVAVGSVYNYFSSKTELLTATVEEVWKEIFHMSEHSSQFADFADSAAWLFERIQDGSRKYPGFFTLHSMSFAAGEKEQGRRMMEQYFGHIKQELLHVLDNDHKIKPDVFNENLTRESFIDFVFMNVTSLMLEKKRDCRSLLEIIRRILY
ncbi:TetR/AcrR family transcriptional regulator [Anaerostipes sp.]|uniref:TetR/AcrR family transcriptional regulator n=1 Tax=Anaerostipes sp. TaxID=1872530 RepID=UPI0025BFE990|nr:TetR/AcrR family transcriptional regulator [Anaerostipes sp.]MBS7008665.1 TetR/AcrR family transcriptional regulator [Anaerostipes sp.]